MTVCIILLLLLLLNFEKFNKDIEIYLLTFGTVVGNIFFPIWFFQGMEKMKYITYINMISKIFFTISIFIFIQKESDYYLVPIFTSLGFIISGIWSLSLVRRKFGIPFRFQSFTTLFLYSKESYHIFISHIAISLYTVSTTFILGLFTSNSTVGYFEAANKIIKASKSLIGPISQTIYPYISKKIQRSSEDGIQFIRKVSMYVALFTGVVSFSILIFSDNIINTLLGNQYQNSIILLTIMSPLPFMTGLSNIFGIQTMINFNRKKPFSTILITGSILNLILSFWLVPLYQGTGSAISIVLVESFITISMFSYLQTNGLKIIK